MKKFMALLIINIIITMPISFAVTLNPPIVIPDSNSAELIVTTDVDTMVNVKYGFSKSADDLEVNSNMLNKVHSMELPNLQSDKRYVYKVIVTDDRGDIAVTDHLVFKTLDDVDPIPVVNVKNISVTVNSVELQWDPIILDKDLDKYMIFRNGVKVGEVDKSLLKFLDESLIPGTDYVYTVRMVDTAGDSSDPSDPLSVTTNLPDINAPIISEFKIISIGKTDATIQITADESVNATLSFGESASVGQAVLSRAFKLSHTLTMTDVSEEVTYFYRVKLCDRSNNCVNSELETFVGGDDVVPPEINVTLPEFHNTFILDIEGSTEPLSQVHLFVNGNRDSLFPRKLDGKFLVQALSLVRGLNDIRIQSIDQAGNTNEVSFDLIVDDQEPQVNLSNIPSITNNETITIEGIVNELVSVSFAIGAGQRKPGRVVGVNSSVSNNTVTLTWNEVSGVGKYVVFRRDVGPIAVVSTTEYKDTTINPVQTFIYEIAAIRENGVQGVKSIEQVITTLSTQGINTGDAEEIDLSKFQNTREKSIQADGVFRFNVDLQEGENFLDIIVVDRANNIVKFQKSIVLDTIPPVVMSPTDLSIYSPAFTAAVEIKGKIDTPNADVIVTVNDKCSGKAVPTSLSALYYKARGVFGCKVKADNNGDFKVTVELERVQLPDLNENLSQVGINSGEVGGNIEGSAGSRFRGRVYDRTPEIENKIKIIAIDQSGLISDPIEGNIKYQICGTGGQWKVDVPSKEFTPGAVYSEHLLRGIAQFGFNVNIEYVGVGAKNKARITSRPTLREFDLSPKDQKQYGYQNMLRDPTTSWNDDFSKGHFLYELKKWGGSADDLKKIKTLKFPIMVEFDFVHDVFGEEVPAVQKNCITMAVQMENRYDIEGKIPEKFLNKTVELIDSTIKVIDTFLPQLQQIQTFLAISCIGSWVVLWFWNTFANEIKCFQVREEATHSLAVKENWPGLDNKWKTCEDFVLEDGSSTKKDQCMSCMEGMEEYREWTQAMHGLCDRVFCPAVPSLSVHAQTHKDPFLAGLSRSGGKRVNNACHGKSNGYYYALSDIDGISNDDPCKKEYKREWDWACPGTNLWKDATTNPDLQGAFAKAYNAVADICEPSSEGDVDTVNIDKKEYVVGKDDDGDYIYEVTGRKEGTVVRSDDGTFEVQGDKKEIRTTNENLAGYYSSYGKYQDCLVVQRDLEKKGGDIKECDTLKDEYEDNMLDYDGDKGKFKKELQGLRDNKVIESSGRKYIVNPTSTIFRAVQCVCVPAIVGFLQYWRTVLGAVRKCFQSILLTKQADSGLCRSVLTIYICDLLYDAFNCLTKLRVNAKGAGLKVSGGITNGVQKFIGAMSQSTQTVQNTVSSRYGSTSAFQNLFNNRKLVYSLCTGAFTGDWDMVMDTLGQSTFRVPIESTGFVPVATRRFISSDPNNEGRTKYIYHVGVGMIAGSDLTWSAELVCSNDNSCPDSGNPGAKCDCAYLGAEKVYPFDGGSMISGESIGGGDEHGDNYIPLTDTPADVRYDKVRLTWKYTNNQNEQVISPPVEKKIKRVGGSPPVGCEFYPLDGTFHCEFTLGDAGRARFIGRPAPTQPVYTIGEAIDLDLKISKKSPGFDDKKRSTSNKQIRYWLGYRVFNQNHVAIPPKVKDPNSLRNDGKVFIELQRDGLYTNDATDGEYLLNLPSITVDPSHFARPSDAVSLPVSRFKLLNDGSQELQVKSVGTQGTDSVAYKIVFSSSTAYTIEEGIVKNGVFNPKPGTKVENQPYDSGYITNLGLFVLPINPGKGKGTVITYDPPILDQISSQCEKGVWTVELELVQPEKRNLDEPLSFNNARRGDKVAVVQGKKQEFKGNDAIKVRIVCDEEESIKGGCSGQGLRSEKSRPCKCNSNSVDADCGIFEDNGDDKRNWYCWNSGFGTDTDENICTPYPKCVEGTEELKGVCVCSDSGKTKLKTDIKGDVNKAVLDHEGYCDGTDNKYCYKSVCYSTSKPIDDIKTAAAAAVDTEKPTIDEGLSSIGGNPIGTKSSIEVNNVLNFEITFRDDKRMTGESLKVTVEGVASPPVDINCDTSVEASGKFTRKCLGTYVPIEKGSQRIKFQGIDDAKKTTSVISQNINVITVSLVRDSVSGTGVYTSVR